MALGRVRIESAARDDYTKRSYFHFFSNLYGDHSIAKYCGACQTLPMTTEENIRVLSRRVTDAPEYSKEFRAVMDKLRANVKARAAREREKVAALQGVFPHSEDASSRPESIHS
jgi:hypothetical protein